MQILFHAIRHTKRCVFPILLCILWREYRTINDLTINSGTLRLINFSNSSQWSSQSKALLASKNVTNTVVDRFLYNSMYSLRVYIHNSVPFFFNIIIYIYCCYHSEQHR